MDFTINIGLSRFFRQGNPASWGNVTLLSSNLFALLVAKNLGGGRGAWLVTFALICVNGLAAWAGNTRRQRLIHDVPTSRIASAAQGYVELFGLAHPHTDETLQAKLSQTPCVWYRYQIEEKNADDDWHIQEFGESDQTFLMSDASGTCTIDPQDAEITTTHKEVWTEFDRRYTEYLLLPNDDIYALGEFVTLAPDTSAKTLRREVSVLLAAWKTEPADLLRRFDSNRDGAIDLQEWEAVRLAAEAQIQALHLVRATEPPTHQLSKPGEQRPYLISNLSHQPLSQRYRWWAWVHLVVFLAGCGGLAYWMLR